MRGGSWYHVPQVVRVSELNWNFPGVRYREIGLRCGRELE
jgi:formylglycine-generating enzyme required for sulfatase activity